MNDIEKMIKVGDRVRLFPNTPFYYQAPGTIGTVVLLPNSGWAKVEWDHKTTPHPKVWTEHYPCEELEIVEEASLFADPDFPEDKIEWAIEFVGGK